MCALARFERARSTPSLPFGVAQMSVLFWIAVYLGIFFGVQPIRDELPILPTGLEQLVEYLVVLFLIVVYVNYRLDRIARQHFLISRTLWRKEKEIVAIKNESERLIHNILPTSVAARLIANPQASVADPFDEATILFCSIPNFKEDRHYDRAAVQILNDIMCEFDYATESYGIEKIKTIGATYMAMAGGLPTRFREDHTHRLLLYALALQRIVDHFNARLGTRFRLRAGMNGARFTAQFAFAG